MAYGNEIYQHEIALVYIGLKACYIIDWLVYYDLREAFSM